jgi:hypothetical protein
LDAKNHAKENAMLFILIAMTVAAIVIAIAIYDHFRK